MSKSVLSIFWSLLLSITPALANDGRVEFRPGVFRTNGVLAVEFWSGQERVGLAPEISPAGIQIRLPGDVFRPVLFQRQSGSRDRLVLGPTQVGDLIVTLRLKRLNPSLIERTLEVKAAAQQKFAVSFDFFPAAAGDGTFATFSESVSKPTRYDTLGGGPEYPDIPGQTFPLAAFRAHGRVFGVIGDSPANWENRCLVELDPQLGRLAILNGDGRGPYELRIKYDA